MASVQCFCFIYTSFADFPKHMRNFFYINLNDKRDTHFSIYCFISRCFFLLSFVCDIVLNFMRMFLKCNFCRIYAMKTMYIDNVIKRLLTLAGGVSLMARQDETWCNYRFFIVAFPSHLVRSNLITFNIVWLYVVAMQRASKNVWVTFLVFHSEHVPFQ